jgi:hypothetical protein
MLNSLRVSSYTMSENHPTSSKTTLSSYVFVPENHPMNLNTPTSIAQPLHSDDIKIDSAGKSSVEKKIGVKLEQVAIEFTQIFPHFYFKLCLVLLVFSAPNEGN